jgi:hypothetical protein
MLRAARQAGEETATNIDAVTLREVKVPAFPQPGQEFAGYRLESLVSQGGMGLVYKAEQIKPRRTVALKILPSEAAADPIFRERFIRESDMAATIEHPNIIPIYQAGEVGGVLYIAMRFVDGPDLKGVLEREGRLDPFRALALLDRVAAALDAAHRAGLVHRDVKPHNMLVGGTPGAEEIYLTDFGLTKNTHRKTRLTRVGHFVGTIDYVSPEQIEGKSVDARTDVYSLGCVLYECLTGRLPFDRETETAIMMAHLEESPPSATSVRPDLPLGIDSVIHKAMAKKMKDRFSTCRELIAAAREELTMQHEERKEPQETVVAAGLGRTPEQPAGLGRTPEQPAGLGRTPEQPAGVGSGGTVVTPGGTPPPQPQGGPAQPRPVAQQGGGWQGQQPGGPTRPGWQPPPQGQPRPGWQPGPGGPGGPPPGGPGGPPPGGPGGPGYGGPPPGGGGPNRGLIFGIVGAVVLIALGVVGFLLFSGGDDDDGDVGASPSPVASTPGPTLTLSPSPVSPSPEDGDDGAFPAAGDEEFVFEHIPLDIQPTCQRETKDLMPKGATAGIACSPSGNKADFIAYYKFPTAPAMDRHYAGDISFVDATRNSGSCTEGGIPSETSYTRGGKEVTVGRILCFNFEGTARINWTNNKLIIYSQAGQFGGNLKGLADFWTTAGPTSLANRS